MGRWPGFDNELWTLSRIQTVVWQRFGVGFHRSHVWRLVHSLDFTPAAAGPPCRGAGRGPHRPLGRQGVAGDQANARARNAWLCFQDESGVCLSPPVRRTWAPRGMTPILRYPGRRGKNLSMSAICCYRPDGSEARLAFGLREGAYDAPSLVRQLDLLSSVLGGDPAIVIWDNLNVHKSHEMRAFVAARRGWRSPGCRRTRPS